MAKPKTHPLSPYSQDALELLGLLIREGRIQKALTATELSARAGISRALLRRMERGDPGCAIGAVFEAAAIAGVPLFEAEARALDSHLSRHRERLTLLPKSVRSASIGFKDDF